MEKDQKNTTNTNHVGSANESEKSENFTSEEITSFQPPSLFPANNGAGLVQKKEKSEGSSESSVEESLSLFAPPPFDPTSNGQRPIQKKEKNETGMNDGVKQKMENSFGTDFSDVNIHTNSKSAEGLGALAYTQGTDVHFASGQFNQNSNQGQQLIGHELTHVVQQKQGRVQATTQLKGVSVNDSSSLEQEADQMGNLAAKNSIPENKKVTQKSNGKTDANVVQRAEKSLPETLGDTQTGPIAERGEGDAHSFSPNDIRQGSIGDCYFLASLGAIANTNPGLLREAITENANGSYTVKLYTEQDVGWIFEDLELRPHMVTIYPTFPVAAGSTDTANPNPPDAAHAWSAPGDENELWVKLIEKAYALLIGSYTQIGSGGLSADAMEVLTGERYTERVISNDTNASAKERIIEMVDANVPVTAAAINISDASAALQEFARLNSILTPHAYTVISANEETITLRNPHGQGDAANGIRGARVAQPVLTWAQFFGLFDQYSDKD